MAIATTIGLERPPGWRGLRGLAAAALALLCLAAPALGQTFPALTGRVVDQAGVLDASLRDTVAARLATLEMRTGDQVVVATVKSLDGYAIEDYANRLFRQWRLGQKDKNNGVLLLIAPTEHKVRIEVGYGLEGTMPDAVAKLIIDQHLVPQFRTGGFGPAVSVGVDDIVKVLTGDPDGLKQFSTARGAPAADCRAFAMSASSSCRRRLGSSPWSSRIVLVMLSVRGGGGPARPQADPAIPRLDRAAAEAGCQGRLKLWLNCSIRLRRLVELGASSSGIMGLIREQRIRQLLGRRRLVGRRRRIGKLVTVMRMLRHLSIALLALAAIGAAAAPATAQTFPALTGRVVDAAGILDQSTRSALVGRLAALEAQNTDQVVVATVASLEGYAVEDYANRLFRQWGLGQKDKNNGVLLLVAPSERKVRIEVGYGLEGTLTDAVASLIISQSIVPHFRSNDMRGGVVQGVDDIVSPARRRRRRPGRDTPSRRSPRHSRADRGWRTSSPGCRATSESPPHRALSVRLRLLRDTGDDLLAVGALMRGMLGFFIARGRLATPWPRSARPRCALLAASARDRHGRWTWLNYVDRSSDELFLTSHSSSSSARIASPAAAAALAAADRRAAGDVRRDA